MKIIECPRDAMQGLHDFVPSALKIKYINALLSAGFDTIDFGSFVSPKAIPQMRDTADVLEGLDLSQTKSKLLAIVANERGAMDAASHSQISYLGYPFSVSEVFQQRNTNASIEDSLSRVEAIRNICAKSNQELVVYLSMAFGNPYNETWHTDLVIGWSERLYREFDIRILALSDTIGTSTKENIDLLFSACITELPHVEFGAHLHTTPDSWKEKIVSAYNAGCRRFDGALKGFGGCPMAADQLTGNMPTEKMISWFNEQEIECSVDNDILDECLKISQEIFS